jgi:hypothetical protein
MARCSGQVKGTDLLPWKATYLEIHEMESCSASMKVMHYLERWMGNKKPRYYWEQQTGKKSETSKVLVAW